MSVVQSPLETSIAEYLDVALAGDLAGARAVAMRMLDRGVPVESVLVDLLCGAQRAVGERWHRAEWSVADEHLVSGLTQRVLDAVAATIPPPSRPRGHVVAVCAEGDWHTLPLHVVAEVLRLHDWEVSHLGASTPADHVAAYLDRRPADALAVSCSVPLFLGGARRLVAVAHERGVPVLVGGRALGADGQRAAVLGADAWAADVRGALVTLDRWTHERPEVLLDGQPPPAVCALLEAEAGSLAHRAFTSLRRRHPGVRGYTAAQELRTLEDLEYIVRFLAAALSVHDRGLLLEFMRWLDRLLQHRGVPRPALDAGVQALAEVVAGVDDGAAELLREAVAAA